MVEAINLGKRLETFVSDLVSDGRFQDRASVLRASVILMEERERKLRRLDAALDRGLADIEADRILSIDEVRASLRARFGPFDRVENV